MTLPLRRLVPDECDNWYYHEPSGLLLHNNFEHGWCAAASADRAWDELAELEAALLAAAADDGPADPDDVLPLPDDYEHARPPVWDR